MSFSQVIIVPQVSRRATHLYVVTALSVALVVSANAQQSITTIGVPVTQNFDGLGSSTNAVLPNSWKIGVNWSTGLSATTQAAGTSGSSISAGGCYNWANGVNATSTERALGFLSSSGYTSPRSIIFAFQNNTGTTVGAISLSWNYEKYRSGSRAFDWTFFHGSTAEANVSASEGNQNHPADANNTVVFNPPASSAKLLTITGLSIPNGATYYLRWTYTGLGGSSNAQGLGIDDFSLTLVATTTPTINTSGSLTAFSTTAGTASSVQTFSVSGSALTSDILVSPPPDFEVATDGMNFSDAATVTQSGGAAGATISVRIKSSAAAGAKSGNIVLTSSQVASVNVAVTGIVAEAGAPLLALSVESIAGLSTGKGAASGATNYVVTGTNLTADVSVVPSTPLLEVSTNGTDYLASLSLTPSSSTVSNTIYLRVAATNVATNFSASVVHTSGTASNSLAVSGSITNLPAVLSVSPNALSGFTTLTNTPSVGQSFVVSGANLLSNVVVAAPAGFEVASDGVSWATNATLSLNAGSVSGTISVRLAATARAGAPSGAVFVDSGPTKTNVAVNGFVGVLPNYVSLTNTAENSYTNDFDGLGTASAANAISATIGQQTSLAGVYGSTLEGWYVAKFKGTGANSASIAADSGSASASGVYNYGNSSDRSLGSLAANSMIPGFGALIKNNTGRVLKGVRIAFVSEAWRSSTSVVNTLTFGYGLVDGTNVTVDNFLTTASATSMPAGNIVGMPPAVTSGSLDGNDPANQSAVAGLQIPAALAPGQTMFIRWQDNDDSGSDAGLALDNVVLTALPFGSNPELGGLALSSGTLGPAFDPATTAYTADVSGETESISVTSTVAEIGASLVVRINGGEYLAVSSGEPSAALPLAVGSNVIEVLVTAEDGVTKNTYSVNVFRASPTNNADLAALTLSSGALRPSFSAANVNYGASVSSTTTSVTITPVTSDPDATVKARVNGGDYLDVANGGASAPLPVSAGDNTVEVMVTARDGVTAKTYAVVITRLPSYILGSDTAENYADSTAPWGETSNGGFGFGPWTFQISQNIPFGSYAGFFLADPATNGISGFSGSAFGLYANTADGSQPASVAATRTLSAPLAVGQKLRFKWGINLDGGNGASGNKGFTLNAGGAELVRVNNAGNSVITFNGVDTGLGSGAKAMIWTFERISATELKVTANDRDGFGVFRTILQASDTAIDRLGFYAENLAFGGLREPYFDDLELLDSSSMPVGSNADLSGLALSSGVLSPAFSSATASYVAVVGNGTSSIAVSLATADIEATAAVRANGGEYSDVPSSGTSGALVLGIGENIVDVKVTAADGTTAKTYVVRVTRAAESREFNSPGGIFIPDGGEANPYPSTINVSGLAWASKLTVRINGLTHSWPDDVNILLMAPDGRVCVLLSDAGGGFPVNGLGITFDDSAGSFAPDYSSLGAGEVLYAPTNYNFPVVAENPPNDYENGFGELGTSLQELLSGAIDGDWKLFVLDDYPADSGGISSWSLVFETTAGGGATAPTVIAPVSYSVNIGSATLGGNVVSSGGATITERGIVFAETVSNADPSLGGEGVTKVSVSGATGVFYAGITGLKSGTSYTFKAFASNDQGTSYTEAATFTTPVPSSNCDLANLTLDNASLNPVFDSATSEYSAQVTKESLAVTVTPTAAQNDASIQIRINGGAYAPLLNGNASQPLALAIGTNLVELLVTAQDGFATKAYSIVVTRSATSSNAQLSNLVLSSGTLNPVFGPGQTSYTVNVGNSTGSINVTPTAAEANATIEVRVNGGSYVGVASGSASSALALDEGVNAIEVKVSAQDGSTAAVYSISVTRTPQMIGAIPDQVVPAGTSIAPIPLALTGFQTNTTIRTIAANLTSGTGQKYEDAGTRILQGLKPDLVMIQEFNVGNNSPQEIEDWVDSTFGQEFQYFREGIVASKAIPNGVVSRWPILQSGSWLDGDDKVFDREFAWAQLDIPGPRNLWVVSVHLKAQTDSTSPDRRNVQAQTLVELVQENVPADDYLLIGGDCNTIHQSEPCLATLSSVVDVTDMPVDESGDPDTNRNRNEQYDRIMAEPELDQLEVPVTVGSLIFSDGLVFDSRVFSDLSLVSPVQTGDSGATNMQHMAVVRSFRIGAPDGVSVQVQSSNPALLPSSNVQVTGSGLDRSIYISPVAGQTGSSLMTVTVSDGISTDSRSFTVSVTGSSYASWSSNAPVTSQLIAKYAIGGATNISANSESTLSSLGGARLSLTAVVRTNDVNLTVLGQASSDLQGSWTTNGVTHVPSPDTNNVSEGCQRRIYSIDLTNSPPRQFLRLRATLGGQ